MNSTLLDKRKTAFLDACRREGVSSPIKRSQIKAIRMKHGLPMPLWIVNDESRRMSHGLYRVDELNATPNIKQQNMTPEPTIVNSTMNLARSVEVLDQEIGNLVPKTISTYVPFGAYDNIEKVIKSGRFFPVYISGLSGNGKTTMVQQICATNNREFVRANITKETDEDDLLGGFRLVNGESVWVDGPAVIAMKRGAILLLDEVNLNPDKILCLQPVMEGNAVFLKKINQYITPMPGFNILATANGKGQGGEDGYDKFIGTHVMNEAFLERFGFCIEHDYPTRAIEKKIVLNIMKREDCIDSEFADLLTRWSEAIRKTYESQGCDDIVTTRRLEHIVVAFSIFRDRIDAVTKGVARFSADTKKSFLDLFTMMDRNVSGVGDPTPGVPPVTGSRDPSSPPF